MLYVFPDQMRMHAMGFWKKAGFSQLPRTETDPVRTPNIDRLAEEGVDNLQDPYQLEKLLSSVIPPVDLTMLKKELGQRLALAGDKWAAERRCMHAITYPQ